MAEMPCRFNSCRLHRKIASRVRVPLAVCRCSPIWQRRSIQDREVGGSTPPYGTSKLEVEM